MHGNFKRHFGVAAHSLQGFVEGFVLGIPGHEQGPFIRNVKIGVQQVEHKPGISRVMEPALKDFDCLWGKRRGDAGLLLGFHLFLDDLLLLEVHMFPFQGDDVRDSHPARIVGEEEMSMISRVRSRNIVWE